MKKFFRFGWVTLKYLLILLLPALVMVLIGTFRKLTGDAAVEWIESTVMAQLYWPLFLAVVYAFTVFVRLLRDVKEHKKQAEKEKNRVKKKRKKTKR